jgi:hypothetical protein
VFACQSRSEISFWCQPTQHQGYETNFGHALSVALHSTLSMNNAIAIHIHRGEAYKHVPIEVRGYARDRRTWKGTLFSTQSAHGSPPHEVYLLASTDTALLQRRRVLLPFSDAGRHDVKRERR